MKWLGRIPSERFAPGLRVRIGEIYGVIIWTPIHLNRDQNVVKLSSLRIDIGVSSRKEAEKLVRVGDPITLVDQFEFSSGACYVIASQATPAK